MSESSDQLLGRARQALADARLLFAAGSAEGAANRAYYAAFNAARAGLVMVGQREASLRKTHRGLIAGFHQFVVATGSVDTEFGRILSDLEHRRLLADYEGQADEDHIVLQSINDAESFIAAINNLSP